MFHISGRCKTSQKDGAHLPFPGFSRFDASVRPVDAAQESDPSRAPPGVGRAVEIDAGEAGKALLPFLARALAPKRLRLPGCPRHPGTKKAGASEETPAGMD